MKRQLAYQICSVIAALAALGGTAQINPALAAGIATVTNVENQGYRTPPGREELSARPADELVQNEALRTADESVIRMRFVDGSELSVEASSEVVLSDYVFDGSASKGLINLNDGLFHFTSNGNDDQGVRLRTPVATIGVRSTEFLVHVDRDNATIIDILSGAVEAVPHGAGQPVTCYQRQSMLVSGPDADAICGELGSFSTAAGPASGDKNQPEPGHRDQDKQRERPQPDPDPAPDPGQGGEGGGSNTFLLFEDEAPEWDYV